jgi:acetolactate synthase-1/2/3 large subunit
VAARYRLPVLTVILDNGGWSAPRFSTLGVHPRGLAAREDTFWSTMTSGTRLARMAAAAGEVAAFEVTDRAELARTLESGIATVRAGTPAVVDVRLAPFSSQILGRSAS